MNHLPSSRPTLITPEGPWNPGLHSQIPAELLPLSTIYRTENVYTTLHEVRELADLTGLDMEDLVTFRPQRLVVHELLVRVTADFSVEDGRKTEDLGINFRRIAEAILTRHIMPHMPQITTAYQTLRTQLCTVIRSELDKALQSNATHLSQHRAGWWWRLFGSAATKTPLPPEDDTQSRETLAIYHWESQSQTTADPLQRAACQSLARVAGAMHAHHGRLWGNRELITDMAANLACNEYGSEEIGRLIEPHMQQAAQTERFRLLPVQANPLVMNTKGASAAGKSTLRPLQRTLAARIGVRWDDFAMISPDIFRKFLLDYDALGSAYKYAGSFTGQELQIVDQKLDRYMARKAARGAMSHLLIDRFRFDTFAPASDVAGSNLLTRFGSLVYLFFVITPPHATVDRAWTRGLEVGRYKAVDDLLAHNIEAYSGIPEVFFTWALSGDKKVHYEFLDNSGVLGEQPRAIAFGWNGEINVLDVKGLLDVERYRKIDVNARSADAVYPGIADMAPERNTTFLAQCAQRLPVVNFVDAASGRIYLRLEAGKLAWCDPLVLTAAVADPQTRAGINAVAPHALAGNTTAAQQAPPNFQELLNQEYTHTLGNWGGTAPY